jgi:small-conductance mechanosensitive channel
LDPNVDLWQHLVYLVTRGPMAVPLWACFVWLILLLTRKGVLKIAWHWLGVKDESLVKELTSHLDVPLQLLLVLLAALPFLRMIGGDIGQTLEKAAFFAAVFLVCHVLIQSLDLLVVRWYLGKVKATSVSPAFHFLFFTVLYVSVLLLLMDVVLNMNVLPLLATSTIATAVLGLALQDTLKNIFAGLTISMEKSFRPGDWVMFKMDGGSEILGEISEIGWRSIKIRTHARNYLMIPNAQFLSQQLINLSFPNAIHAVTLEVPVAKEIAPAKVCDALLKALDSVKEVAEDPKPSARLGKFSLDEIVYKLQYFSDKVAEKDRINGLILEAAWQELSQIGAIASK